MLQTRRMMPRKNWSWCTKITMALLEPSPLFIKQKSTQTYKNILSLRTSVLLMFIVAEEN